MISRSLSILALMLTLAPYASHAGDNWIAPPVFDSAAGDAARQVYERQLRSEQAGNFSASDVQTGFSACRVASKNATYRVQSRCLQTGYTRSQCSRVVITITDEGHEGFTKYCTVAADINIRN